MKDISSACKARNKRKKLSLGRHRLNEVSKSATIISGVLLTLFPWAEPLATTDDEDEPEVEEIVVVGTRTKPLTFVFLRPVLGVMPTFGVGDGGSGEKPEEETGDQIDCWKQLTSIPNTPVTGPFGERRSSGPHKGIDIGVPTGTSVFAGQDGTVVNHYEKYETKSRASSLGNFIFINNRDGSSARYLHLKQGSVSVKNGQFVRAGQKIAEANETGSGISGAHLHFDLHTSQVSPNGKTQGKPVDPQKEFNDCD